MNREKVLRQKKEYRLKNKDKIKEYNRRYYQKKKSEEKLKLKMPYYIRSYFTTKKLINKAIVEQMYGIGVPLISSFCKFLPIFNNFLR